MYTAATRRIAAFEHRHARAQASEVMEFGWGYAVLQHDFPYSHYHNRIAVTGPASAAAVLAAAEDILGGAGLLHRYISVHSDELGQALASPLAAAGYSGEAIVDMIYAGPASDPVAHPVQEVAFEAMRPAILRDWRIQLPDASDDQLAQLADRTRLYERGAHVTLLAAMEADEVIARADLYLDPVARIAQFENLFTHPTKRGNGYGGSLLRDALRRGHDAGCDISFLTAAQDDWPIDWYRRFGYEAVATAHHFTRIDSAH